MANDSSSGGNYWNNPDSAKSMEKTGTRECGGYSDGQGNSYKIVTSGAGYVLVGGGYNRYGNNYPVAYVSCDNFPLIIQHYSSGVLVLTK